jgi:hypothetical protein
VLFKPWPLLAVNNFVPVNSSSLWKYILIFLSFQIFQVVFVRNVGPSPFAAFAQCTYKKAAHQDSMEGVFDRALAASEMTLAATPLMKHLFCSSSSGLKRY